MLKTNGLLHSTFNNQRIMNNNNHLQAMHNVYHLTIKIWVFHSNVWIFLSIVYFLCCNCSWNECTFRVVVSLIFFSFLLHPYNKRTLEKRTWRDFDALDARQMLNIQHLQTLWKHRQCTRKCKQLIFFVLDFIYFIASAKRIPKMKNDCNWIGNHSFVFSSPLK